MAWVRAKTCHGSSLRRLERQGDTLAGHVDLENLDGDRGANLDDLVRVVDVLPGELGNVDETVNATEVHEGTEVHDGGDYTLANLALLERVEEVAAGLGLVLLEECAAGKNDVVTVLVELDDLRIDVAADVGLQVANATHLDERCGKESAQADVDDEATLDDLDDVAGDDTVGVLDLLDLGPGTLLLCAALREEKAAFLVFLLEDVGLDAISYGDDLIGVDVVLDRQFLRGNNTLGLVANVEKDLVVVHLDNGALDDVPVVEVLDGLVNSCEEFFLRANIVDGDLRGGRLLGRGSCH